MLLLAFLLAATPVQDHLARGEKALTELEYEVAAYELMLAATDPGATDERKLRANLLAGIAHRVLGKDLDARLNFRYVILRAPETKLPEDTGPKVLLFFESVRQEIEAERAAAPPAPTPTPGPAPALPEPGGPSWPALAGAGVAGLGAVALLGGASGILFAETQLADPDRDGDKRDNLRSVGQWSVLGALVGGAMAAGGAIAWGLAP